MPEQINCFVFRTANVDFVKKELKEDRLRQGWSPPGTSLLNADRKPRSKEAWTRAYKDACGNDPSRDRHKILRRMLDMKEGDLVICPKMPDYSCFTIAIVSGPYRFEVAPGTEGFGHIIPVKEQCTVKNQHDDDAQTIHDLFKSLYFTAPVAQVQGADTEPVLEAAKRLRQKKDTLSVQKPDDIRKERYAQAKREAAKHFIKYVQKNWKFAQFESAVGEAFVRKGYKRRRGNSPHGESGADADYVLSIPMPGFEDLGNVDCPLYVLILQVKHKRGRDHNDVAGVNQLIASQPSERERVVSKVLFSSADSFTEECHRLAYENNVTLICGEEAGLFFL